MAFPVYMQVNGSEDNRLDKSLTTVSAFEGVLKEECSLMTPTIVFEQSASTLATCNYATIPAFGRQYFITDIRTVRASLTEVSLRVDVLSTYAAQIRGCYGIAARQENQWNLYLDDGTFKTYSNPTVLTKNFPNPFPSDFSFILAVAGDG